MTTLKELQQRVVAFRDAREWQQFHNPKDMALSLVLEASEVLELFQWKREAELNELLPTMRQQLSDELADVLYWVLLMSRDAEIDLAAAFEAKMAKNEAKYPIEQFRGSREKYRT